MRDARRATGGVGVLSGCPRPGPIAANVDFRAVGRAHRLGGRAGARAVAADDGFRRLPCRALRTVRTTRRDRRSEHPRRSAPRSRSTRAPRGRWRSAPRIDGSYACRRCFTFCARRNRSEASIPRDFPSLSRRRFAIVGWDLHQVDAHEAQHELHLGAQLSDWRTARTDAASATTLSAVRMLCHALQRASSAGTASTAIVASAKLALRTLEVDRRSSHDHERQAGGEHRPPPSGCPSKATQPPPAGPRSRSRS